MPSSERTLVGSSIPPIRLVFLMWLVFTIEYLYSYNFGTYGILPRTYNGLIGIVTAPILHGNVLHLVSNTIPLLFLGATLYYFYNRIANLVFLRCYFITNILVWLFARSSFHIGASGLVYGIASFLIFFGLFRRDFKSLFISVIVIMLYGGIFYGVIPTESRISWESHLFGAIVGLITALSYRSNKT